MEHIPDLLPSGVTVGHWTDTEAQTGCTVVLVPDGAVAGVDVRGGAPGTLGTDALRPGRLVREAHAILLTGGSAFGLDAASGVMRYLEERGNGLAIGSVRVPIVAGAVIFDLSAGDPATRPDQASGYAACVAATPSPTMGSVGAGTGATVAKMAGSEPHPGGLGIASVRVGEALVGAIMVVNSVGGIWDDEEHRWIARAVPGSGQEPMPGTNTTIGVVVTDTTLTKEQANRVASVAHDGIARAVRPAHTMYDGDTMFCLATGAVSAPYDAIEIAAADVVARAIVAGVRAGQE